MRALLDTNFIIAAEPMSSDEIEANAEVAQEVLRCMQKLHWEACLHPAQDHDLKRDRQSARLELRQLKLKRYHVLEPPFHLPPEVAEHSAPLEYGSNDWVDWQLLGALKSGAVSYLVSDDGRLHKRAARIGVVDRVFTAQDALQFLRDTLGETHFPRLPAVDHVKAYALDDGDPIFESLRADYDGFDAWLLRCKQLHRDVLRILDPAAKRLAGLAILKKEEKAEHGLPAGALKVCTFKVADIFAGQRYGELLLRAVFEYAEANSFRQAYVTVLPHHELLINFLGRFGFKCIATLPPNNEGVFAKPFGYREEADAGDPFDFHVRNGPSALALERARFFIVPIQPKWISNLFPDCDDQRQLLSGAYACGNAISKAYLSNTVTAKLRRGDNLLFYRSLGRQDVPTIGVVEDDPIRSRDADELARYVGPRTVYTRLQIKELTDAGPVLAIRFRHALRLKPALPLEKLKENGVLTDYPQTLQEVRAEGLPWLKSTLKERFYYPSGPSTPAH